MDFVACWRATGRTVTALHFDNDCISASGGCDDVSPKVERVVRAGRWVAFYVDNEVSNAAIALANVRAGTTPRVDGYVPLEDPRDLVVGRDGVLAWISGYVFPNLSKRFEHSRELRICDTACRDSGSKARRIARGRKLSGLRLKNGRLFWSDGKRVRSVRVARRP